MDTISIVVTIAAITTVDRRKHAVEPGDHHTHIDQIILTPVVFRWVGIMTNMILYESDPPQSQ